MNDTPKTLTIDESNKLLNALLRTSGTKKQRRLGIRNYCMALLMLEAGLRVGEVVNLRMLDLWYAGQPKDNLLVSKDFSHGKSDRLIPLSEKLLEALPLLNEAWWYDVTPSHCFHAFFWGKARYPLTTRQVERIIRKAGIQALGRPIHPHILRHTFASRLMRTCNARVVQELLGHRNLSSTQIYTHPNQEDLKKAVDSLPAVQKSGCYDSFLSAD